MAKATEAVSRATLETSVALPACEPVVTGGTVVVAVGPAGASVDPCALTIQNTTAKKTATSVIRLRAILL